MPGIYINDGGQIGNSLGSVISQIANNYSPKTIADAELLRQQTEAANWGNRKASTEVPAYEQGVLGAGQLAQGIPSGSQSSGTGSGLGGAIAGYGVPAGGASTYNGQTSASARGVVNTAGYSPLARVLAGRYAQGAGIDELKTGMNYGYDLNSPGSDPTTQTELFKARGTPTQVGEGSTLYLNPAQAGAAAPAPSPQQGGAGKTYSMDGGAAGGSPTQGVTPAVPTVAQNDGGVLHGADPYSREASTQQAAADVADFNKAQSGALEAQQSLHEVQSIRDLYNSVIKDASPGTQISTQLQNYLHEQTGLTFTTKAQALQEISARMGKMMMGLRGPLGIQRVAGPEITLMQRMLAQGNMPPAVFNDVMNSMEGSMQQSVQAGVAASQYNMNPTRETAAAIRQKMSEIASQDPLAPLQQKYPTMFPRAGAAAGGDTSSLPRPATPADAAALPSGTRFIAPDGKIKMRP